VSAAGILSTLGRKARELRRHRGLTLRALADRSGLSLRFLMDVEAGRGNISVRRLAELAAALETTAASLIASDDGQQPATVIALLGLRGAGKTSVGRRLARRLRLRFVELDHEIERRASLALGEIFTLHGEGYYRQLERETLLDLMASGQSVVVAVGGGLVTAPETYALLRQHATTVWLKARAVDYWNRVVGQGDRRPIDQHPRAREALQALIAERESLYARASVTVETTGLTLPETVNRIEHALTPG
jgi:XRE family aerobic/anaerobic benzoate catabolism transcriptional regulator